MSLRDGLSQYTVDDNPSDEGLDNRSIISNRISQIKLEKENLKNALIDKGIDMENIPFTEYHNKINELKSEEINYPGYVLKTGDIYSTSGTGKSLTLSLPEGIIPLTGYMGSSFSVGALNENPVTIRHTVSTKMSNGSVIKTVFDSAIKGDGSSSSRYLNGWIDFTAGEIDLENLKNIKTIYATREAFSYSTFSISVKKWLEPML